MFSYLQIISFKAMKKNYYPYPKMKFPVALFCSDRALVFLSITAWQQHSSQNDIQEKKGFLFAFAAPTRLSHQVICC